MARSEDRWQYIGEAESFTRARAHPLVKGARTGFSTENGVESVFAKAGDWRLDRHYDSTMAIYIDKQALHAWGLRQADKGREARENRFKRLTAL